jgi:hypothetical protein
MSESEKLEALLGGGGEVRLGRREAQDVLQKLRARGAESEAADRIESGLAQSDEVVLGADEATALLEELRASGRRWVFGDDAERELPTPRAPEPEPQPEAEPQPEPEQPGRFRRLWRR